MKIIITLLTLLPGLVFSQVELEEKDLLDKNIHILKQKTELGADLTKGIGKYNTRPLVIAVANNQYQLIEFLLKNDAHKYEPRKHGFRNNFPNPALHSTENSFLFAYAVNNSTNPIKVVELLMRYMDTSSYLDEILFFSLGGCPNCLKLSKKLINLGAKPTKIFTGDELGGITNAITKTWPHKNSKKEIKDAHKFLLVWLKNNEGLTKNEVYTKYVKAMHSGPYDH